MPDATIAGQTLPVRGSGTVGTAWWGMLTLIATEAMLFVYLVFSFLYLGAQSPGNWPPDGPPPLRLALPDTCVLLLSSAVLQWALRGQRKEERPSVRWIAGLLVTILLGVAFVAIQGLEWSRKGFSYGDDSYSCAYFTLTGLHLLHVIAGLVALTIVLAWSLAGRFRRHAYEQPRLAVLYWHFVDAVWLVVFATIYLLPRIG